MMNRVLGDYFPGLVQSDQRTLVSKPGWLEAWCCEGWFAGDERQKATFLVSYRSPLVSETSRLFKPVADLMLGADHVEVIRAGRHEDSKMMHGFGETLFVRLYASGITPPYSLGEIRSILERR